MERQLFEDVREGLGACFGALGAPPSITPPVRTVVLPPSYGVTSFFDVSMYTRACRALSRRDCLGLPESDAVVEAGDDDNDDDTDTEETEP